VTEYLAAAGISNPGEVVDALLAALRFTED
jgi:hypothetical protein